MKRIAVTVSAMTFFAMALVGMVMGQSPFVCTIRALIGAVISYLAARFAIQLAVDVMIRSVVHDGGPESPVEESVTEESGEAQG
jgi:hypothetical protein